MLGSARKSPVCSMTVPLGSWKRTMVAPGQLDTNILGIHREQTKHWGKGTSLNIKRRWSAAAVCRDVAHVYRAHFQGEGTWWAAAVCRDVARVHRAHFQEGPAFRQAGLASKPLGQLTSTKCWLRPWLDRIVYANCVTCGKHFSSDNSKKHQNSNWQSKKKYQQGWKLLFCFVFLKNLT